MAGDGAAAIEAVMESFSWTPQRIPWGYEGKNGHVRIEGQCSLQETSGEGVGDNIEFTRNVVNPELGVARDKDVDG